MPPQSTLADSIRNIPPVTRFFTITTVIVCFADSLQIISPNQLICYLPIFVEKFKIAKVFVDNGNVLQKFYGVGYLLFQSHRFFTAFLLPVGILVNQPFQAILDIYFFYTFANHLESKEGKFRRNFPDCLWFTLVAGTIIVISSLAYSALIDESHFPVHHQMMLSCVTYIWSRSLKNSLINFLGLVPIKAYYLPLFNLFFKLIVNGYSSFLDTFLGICGGYLYQCIQSDTLPIYNLFPGAYARYLTSRANSQGKRVGTLFPGGEASGNFTTIHDQANQDLIDDSIFDKGYLKAPLWLYRLLNIPSNTSQRTTAFYPKVSPMAGVSVVPPTRPVRPGDEPVGSSSNTSTASGSSWFSGNGAFKGKGHRLGQ